MSRTGMNPKGSLGGQEVYRNTWSRDIISGTGQLLNWTQAEFNVRCNGDVCEYQLKSDSDVVDMYTTHPVQVKVNDKPPKAWRALTNTGWIEGGTTVFATNEIDAATLGLIASIFSAVLAKRISLI